MKKIPPWALVAGAIAIGGLIWLIKQRREKLSQEAETETTTETGAEPFIAGVEVPEEYPPGGLGGGGYGGAIGSAGESQSVLSEFFRSEQTALFESEKQQSEFEKNLSQQLRENQEALQHISTSSGTVAQGSGGGAPETTRSGTTAAPTTPPKNCTAGYTWNSRNGAPGAHSCYKDITCGNGCQGHKYQDGHSECQTKKSGKCSW